MTRVAGHSISDAPTEVNTRVIGGLHYRPLVPHAEVEDLMAQVAQEMIHPRILTQMRIQDQKWQPRSAKAP